MALWPRQSAQGWTAAGTAAIVLLAWISAPVHAAPDRDVLCEASEPTLGVFATELSVAPVNNSEYLLNEHLLRPRAESALRSAFADDPKEIKESEPEAREEEGDVLDQKPVTPSAFGREPSPFKRQMYRRDI
ncbi:MAG TPA: hypothetical protein VLA11_00010 [Woeseiaceae bacterium]|jgi:hypothetical protein|nr:hypothetical protein [Woeseiaceae bacterium]